MSDHWGGFDHHDDLPDFSDTHDLPDTHEPDPDLPDHHEPDPGPHTDAGHPDLPADDATNLPEIHDTLPAVDDFPPTLHVGDLPEPVDGFPWVDAATLGHAGTYDSPADPVDPHDLAAYAGIDVPEGTDPWTALAASDDPAVAALARWWTPGQQ